MRGRYSVSVAGALVWLGLELAGCSAIVDPDVGKLGSAPPPACKPGQVTSNCACAGGKVGFQVCNASGSYNPCQCGTAGPGVIAGTGGSAGNSSGSSGSAGKSGRGGR